MTYKVDETITRFLPENSLNLNPLEYDWEEAENAIIFTSDLDYPSYEDFEESLIEYYTSLLGPEAQINPEGEDEFGCISFWIKLGKDGSELENRNIDIHISWTQAEESFQCLNSWIGSTLLEEIVNKEKPKLAGMIRIRPVE